MMPRLLSVQLTIPRVVYSARTNQGAHMRVGRLHVALCAMVCIAASSAGWAQDTGQVVVAAERVESTTIKGQAALSIVYKVSFADLNLATHAGAAELQKRVKDSAIKACAQLVALYPTSVETDPTCVTSATKNGLAQADKAIAEAEKKGAK
jgi:UrcA family protein